MNSTEHHHKEESPSGKIIERDVLGLEKNPVMLNSPKARPTRIFMVIAILAAAALAYWLVAR